jgi:hypothetical protein
VFKEHLRKEFDMNRNIFVRLAGWSLMVGAVLFLPGASAMMLYDTQYAIEFDSPVLQVYMWIMFLSPVLLAVGLMGLRTRYGVGGPLVVSGAVVGGLLVIVGTFGQMFAPVYSVSENYYGVWLFGAYILFVSLTFFGVVALRKKPLPRWNALPLVSGLWLAIVPLIGPLFLLGIRRLSVEAYLVILIAGFIVTAVAQIMLGYILQADALQEMAIA